MMAGALRRRIAIQRRATSKDASGQQVTTWSDVLTGVPADIESLDGRELMTAQAINAELTHKIVIRYHPLMADPVKTAALRAVYQAAGGVRRIFNIQSAMNVDERNRTIEMLASEGLNEGG